MKYANGTPTDTAISASAGSDYVAIVPPGTPVLFPALNTAQTVAVTVNGDSSVEPDETFEARVLPNLVRIDGQLPPPLATGRPGPCASCRGSRSRGWRSAGSS